MATAKQIAANRKNSLKGGRKKGQLNATTLERIAAAKEYNEKAIAALHTLFNAKMRVALGESFLYKIEKYYEGTGKSRVLKRKKPKLVTAQWEIEDYLANRLDTGDLEDAEDTYFYISSERGNSSALEDLINRAIGTVVQKVGTEDEDGKIQPITGMTIIFEGKKKE